MTDNPVRLAAKAERHDVRKLVDAEVPTVSRSMTKAFFDDPVVGEWCLADESRRMRRLERLFELFLRRVYLPHDECYVPDGLVGGAFWLPPGKWRVAGLSQLGLVARLAPVTGSATPRILRVLSYVEAKHPHEPHYYLQFVGVEPDSQGRGTGSALLRPVLERCDRERVPSYLEASTERSAALYERHGFRVVEEVALPGGGPPLWRMWREPTAS